MPAAHHWAVPLPGSRFLFLRSRGSSRTCSHCAHPCAARARGSAACTRIGWRDRNRCTACRSAVRIRTLDTVQRARPAPEARFHTVSNATRCASPASAGAVGRRYCLSASASLPALSAACRRGPDNRVDGISATHILPLKNTLSRL